MSDELLAIARSLAAETGEMIVEGRRRGSTIAGTKTSAADVVTEMDLAAEAHLRARLAELRPGDAILGEEGGATAGTTGVTWILDPIDGTVNYLYNLPHYSVSVAAVTGPPTPEEWQMEAGAVYEGGAGVLWSASRGGGAWRGEQRLEAREGPPLSNALLSTGFQYIAERRALQGALVAQILPQVRDIRRLGSCAVDLCLVAAGRVDGYYEHGLNPWDFAAAALIAIEAGIRVEGLHGRAPNTDLTLAAPQGTFDELHAALVAAGADHLWDAPRP